MTRARNTVMRNALWSFVGLAVPMLLAVALMPLLIGRLGGERFGLLTIIWGGIGYFSLFDLGLGRALTHQVSLRMAQGRGETIDALVASGATTLLLLGALAGVLVGAVTPWLVSAVFAVPSAYHGEAVGSFLILAASLPCVLVSAGLIGVLEGLQRFQTIALIRVPLGASSFLLPASLSLVTSSLEVLTLGLAAVRLIVLIVLVVMFRKALFVRRNRRGLGVHDARELLRFGGWITVSNVVGPILVYFDRFFIGAISGLTAVGFYVTPQEIVSRLSVIPQAVMAALIPAMTAEISKDLRGAEVLARSSGRVIVLTMLPLTLLVAFFAEELLSWWISPEFAKHSAPVAKILAAGMLVNTFARVPFISIQSVGRADLTAKIHLAELLPYLAMLVWAVREYGVIGAAAVWLARVLVDMWLLCWAMASVTPALGRSARNSAVLGALAVPALLFAAQVESFAGRALILVVVTLVVVYAMLRELRPAISLIGARP